MACRIGLGTCVGGTIVLGFALTRRVTLSGCMCLGGDVSRGAAQRAFNGQLDYDYIMWIDSDILFTPEQFVRLLSHDVDIVSGLYLMEGGIHYATVKDWDEEFFRKSVYPPIGLRIECAWLGFRLHVRSRYPRAFRAISAAKRALLR